MSGNLKLETRIDKGEVTRLCADAISELERAVRLFPTWPDVLFPEHYEDSIEKQLDAARRLNDGKDRATAHSVFGEEYYEFIQAALKPGNHVAARIELVQAMAMLLRIGCHLENYVAKFNLSADQEPRVNPEAAACPAGTPSERIGHEEPPRLGCEKGVLP